MKKVDDVFLSEWEGSSVRVVFLDGKVLSGLLLGVGKYTLVLRRGEGVYLVYKSAIKYVYRGGGEERNL